MVTLNLPDNIGLLELSKALASIGLSLIATRNGGLSAIPIHPLTNTNFCGGSPVGAVTRPFFNQRTAGETHEPS